MVGSRNTSTGKQVRFDQSCNIRLLAVEGHKGYLHKIEHFTDPLKLSEESQACIIQRVRERIDQHNHDCANGEDKDDKKDHSLNDHQQKIIIGAVLNDFDVEVRQCPSLATKQNELINQATPYFETLFSYNDQNLQPYLDSIFKHGYYDYKEGVEPLLESHTERLSKNGRAIILSAMQTAHDQLMCDEDHHEYQQLHPAMHSIIRGVVRNKLFVQAGKKDIVDYAQNVIKLAKKEIISSYMMSGRSPVEDGLLRSVLDFLAIREETYHRMYKGLFHFHHHLMERRDLCQDPEDRIEYPLRSLYHQFNEEQKKCVLMTRVMLTKIGAFTPTLYYKLHKQFLDTVEIENFCAQIKSVNLQKMIGMDGDTPILRLFLSPDTDHQQPSIEPNSRHLSRQTSVETIASVSENISAKMVLFAATSRLLRTSIEQVKTLSPTLSKRHLGILLMGIGSLLCMAGVGLCCTPLAPLGMMGLIAGAKLLTIGTGLAVSAGTVCCLTSGLPSIATGIGLFKGTHKIDKADPVTQPMRITSA